MSSSKAVRNAASALFREGGPNLGPKLPATGQDQAAPRSSVSRTQRWKSTLIGTNPRFLEIAKTNLAQSCFTRDGATAELDSLA